MSPKVLEDMVFNGFHFVFTCVCIGFTWFYRVLPWFKMFSVVNPFALEIQHASTSRKRCRGANDLASSVILGMRSQMALRRTETVGSP